MTTPFACPFVTSNDDGIRPAGPQDACFYCGQKIGARHLFACVTLTVSRTYRVLLDGVDIGSWLTDDPVSWGWGERSFHKNEASWCSDNVTHVGTLAINCALPIVESGCLCRRIAFEPVEGEPEYVEAPPGEPEGGGFDAGGYPQGCTREPHEGDDHRAELPLPVGTVPVFLGGVTTPGQATIRFGDRVVPIKAFQVPDEKREPFSLRGPLPSREWFDEVLPPLSTLAEREKDRTAIETEGVEVLDVPVSAACPHCGKS